MKIYLHYTNSNHRGPGKVVQNLLKGIEKLQANENIEVLSRPGKADFVGCLQHPSWLFSKLPKNTLMGPNLFVLPHEERDLCNQFTNFVVPSQWVKDKYESFHEMKNKNIWIWSVGIDTKVWSPNDQLDFEFNAYEMPIDCFVYFKNRSEQELEVVKALLEKHNLKYKIIKYGSYDESKLMNLCKRSKFAILLTGTESQGIAYMNILSTNTPCFVLNKKNWIYENDNRITASASSVPYFDSTCGEIIDSDTNLENAFEIFLKNVKDEKYFPRKYIVDNHNLKKSAERYINLLKKSHEL